MESKMSDKKIANAIYQETVENCLSSFKASALAINKVHDSLIRRVPEDYFYNILLSIWRDWICKRPNANVGRLLNAADGIYRPMIITDYETGEDLFTVPPAYNRLPPVVIQRKDNQYLTTVADLVDRQINYQRNGEVRKALEIDNAITESYDFNGDSKRTEEHYRKIAFIYDRYQLDATEVFGEDAESIVDYLLERGKDPVEDSPEKVETIPEFKDDPMDLEQYDF